MMYFFLTLLVILTGFADVLEFAFIRFYLDYGLNAGRMDFNFRLNVTCRDVLVMIVRIGLGQDGPTEWRLSSTTICSPDLLLL